jgi:hypothetical protein
MALPLRLLELTQEFTNVCRLDDLACPPVPPRVFHLLVVYYRLVEIERALIQQRYYMLPPRDTSILTEKIYDTVIRIHWCVCGRPPAREKDYLHASEECLLRMIGALRV